VNVLFDGRKYENPNLGDSHYKASCLTLVGILPGGGMMFFEWGQRNSTMTSKWSVARVMVRRICTLPSVKLESAGLLDAWTTYFC
jgi:hypothetical protein